MVRVASSTRERQEGGKNENGFGSGDVMSSWRHDRTLLRKRKCVRIYLGCGGGMQLTSGIVTATRRRIGLCDMRKGG
ncbi:hypothetical protein E2542_SST09350 [Spatholobus suberectus]|nr:hypothetical protein E2542_SST09350 [Spatholobus suberectus]